LAIHVKKISKPTQTFYRNLTTKVLDLQKTPSKTASVNWYTNFNDTTALKANSIITTPGNYYVEQVFQCR
jgi:hypothetical protein